MKPKNYFLEVQGDKNQVAFKGFPANVVKDATYETFEETIKKKKQKSLQMRCIRSVNHNLYHIRITKLAYHELDISRCYPDRENFNYSLPYFNHRLDNCHCLSETEWEEDEDM